MRAPIDQIVLTAKAAGVSDVVNFDWIQRPSEAELARAPHYLRQIGALDADGDLTEHGLELRNFAEEIDAGMIAMATHGRTGFAHLLSGSIAEDVVNHSKRPVLTYNLNMK